MQKTRLVYGVGINDADYSVYHKGKVCKFYKTWFEMIRRCYSPVEQERHPTYKGCSVCPAWHRFSVFKAWMEQQDWQGKELDKDLLIPGNQIYSPETCVFVSAKMNNFTTESGRSRGDYPIGVYLREVRYFTKPFRSRCSNPFTGKQEHLGCFSTPEAAHLAWKKRKHELANQLADTLDDPRLAAALRARYALDENIEQLEECV